MIRKLVLFIGIWAICSAAYSQLKNHIAPVNTYFYEYAKSNGGIPSNGNSTGYIPPYTNLSEPEQNINEQTLIKAGGSFNLPARFDLREHKGVTGVRDQGGGKNGGNCWTFSSVGSIESFLTYNGIANKETLPNGKPKEFDLSEQDMAACHGYEWPYGEGGNEYFAIGYLSRLIGPANESEVPYNTANTKCVETKKRVYDVPETRWIYNSPVLTKLAIMNYGAVSTNIHWDPAFYNGAKNSFCSQGSAGPNHAILVVGWDDNRETHVGKGAWIAKNSWSSAWGEGGFFYISYKDNKILKPASFYPVIWGTNDFQSHYHYDKTGVVTFFGFNSETNYTLVKFSPNKEQFVKKVGTFIARTGTKISIEIYDDKSGDTLKNLLSTYNSEGMRSPGFYTFDIPTKVKDDFFVKIKYFSPGTFYSIPVELDVENYAQPAIEPSGKQWLSGDGLKWKPLGSDIKDWEADVIVHAYATDSLGPKANFTMNKEEVCAGSTITFTSNSIGNINSYQWVFDSPVFKASGSGIGPHSYTISDTTAPGVYYALLKVTGPLGSDLIFKEYRVVKKLLPLIATNNVVKLGDTTAISAITDGDTYSWFPTTNLNNSNAKEVLFTSKIPGKYKYTVTATQGTCSGSSTVVIDMRKPPENDNICNAIELKATENGPFINIDATVEFNEPAPKDTCCNCPLTWCDEGGLQNSVWFKYTVPEGVNTISIDSRGMDDQIAVYNSESCKSVKLSDLIAANDDYYDFPPYASAIEEIKVSPGKTYWIQVDGSAGGVADTFYITIKDGLLNNVTKNISGSSALKVFPNPNKGEFNVLLHSLANEPVTIQLFDLTGKLAFQKIVYKPAGELKTNISGKFSKGAYILRATSRSVSETGRLIIE